MPNGDLKNNAINLHIENFEVTEVGDIQDMVDAQISADLNVQNPGNVDLFDL